MSILKKCKKVLSGCIHKHCKETNEIGPILDENFNTLACRAIDSNANINNNEPAYLEYDNLQHISTKLILKDTTNTRALKRILPGAKKHKDNNNNVVYNELYAENLVQKNGNLNTEAYYSQIQDDLLAFSDHEPLIDSKEIDINENTNANNNNTEAIKSLTSIRDLDTFSSQPEAFEWYLKLMFDQMVKCIQEDKNLAETDRAKRLSIANAHVLYAHNFYQMRTSTSSTNSLLKLQLSKIHPCLIALACLLDSDAVRIVDSHKCECDNYIYLFATRLKFCTWKSRFYIILKRPNRSSIDRLTLIQDLTSCHRLLQDKPIKV